MEMFTCVDFCLGHKMAKFMNSLDGFTPTMDYVASSLHNNEKSNLIFLNLLLGNKQNYSDSIQKIGFLLEKQMNKQVNILLANYLQNGGRILSENLDYRKFLDHG